MRKSLALLSTLFVAGTAAAADPFTPWTSGEKGGVGAADLAVALEDGEFYSDRYTLEAWFEDKSRIYISYLVSNLGPGTGKLTVKSRVIDAAGKEHYFKKEVDQGGYQVSASPFKYTAAGHTLSGSARSFSASGNGGSFSFDLDFKSGLAPWKPGNGHAGFGVDEQGYLKTALIQPKAVVTGSVTLGGKKASVKGYGYVVHTSSNIPPHGTYKRFVDIRSIDGETVVWLKQFTMTEQYGGKTLGYLYVARGDQVLVAAGRVSLKMDKVQTDGKHANKYKVPLVITATGKRKDTEIAISIEAPSIAGREDELESRGAVEAALIRQYAQPVRYTMDAKVTVTVTEAGKEPVVSTEKASYEVSHLNK